MMTQFAEDELNRKVLVQQKAPETIVWVLRQSEYQQQLATVAAMNRSVQQEENSNSQLEITIRQPTPWEEKPTYQPTVNIPQLKAISSAVWKLSRSSEARDRFRQLGIVRLFIRHLNQPTEEVNYY